MQMLSAQIREDKLTEGEAIKEGERHRAWKLPPTVRTAMFPAGVEACKIVALNS